MSHRLLGVSFIAHAEMKENVGFYSASSKDAGFMQSLGRKKPVEKSMAEVTSEKTLQWYDLTAYGIAATVGSGVYVTVGQVARNLAGPAVLFSTLIAGLLSLFTGICYLEFASALPISGSGYAYFYALMGEFLGWFIGWNLTLEYGFAAALIAEGWTNYLVSLLQYVGLSVPSWMHNIAPFESDIFRVNLIAGLVIILLGAVVSRGARFGTLFTNTITIVNLSLIVFIIAVGAFYVKAANWSPFVHSMPGVFTGGGNMFFSFIGYDTVSTLATEAVNPSRDIPIAILLTVGVATGLYILVGLVLTGMVPYGTLDKYNPLTGAFLDVKASYAYYIIAIAALLMMAATMFACLVGQPKIFQAIAKDGLMPKAFARENGSGTPIFSVTASTLLIAAMAAFVNGDAVGNMVTFGTLFAMSTLCAGVIIVRFDSLPRMKVIGTGATVLYFLGSLTTSWISHYFASSALLWTSVALTMALPFAALAFLFATNGSKLVSKSTAFACPLMPLIPCIAIASNSYVMMSLTPISWTIFQFGIWTLIGLAVYFGYGIHHSHLKLGSAEKA